jgi:hypothetical protein
MVGEKPTMSPKLTTHLDPMVEGWASRPSKRSDMAGGTIWYFEYIKNKFHIEFHRVIPTMGQNCLVFYSYNFLKKVSLVPSKFEC